MKNYLEHAQVVELYNKDQKIFKDLFGDVQNFSTFTGRMLKVSKRYKEFGYSPKEEEGYLKMIGDVFEIFAEAFFKVFGADNRIGVYGYTPEKPSKDVGIDGVGKCMKGLPLVVQVKFRAEPNYELKTGDLRNFQGAAIQLYDVPVKTANNLVVFTSCSGVHYITKDEVFGGYLRPIGYREIKSLVDNNGVFWTNLWDLIEETIKTRYHVN